MLSCDMWFSIFTHAVMWHVIFYLYPCCYVTCGFLSAPLLLCDMWFYHLGCCCMVWCVQCKTNMRLLRPSLRLLHPSCQIVSLLGVCWVCMTFKLTFMTWCLQRRPAQKVENGLKQLSASRYLYWEISYSCYICKLCKTQHICKYKHKHTMWKACLTCFDHCCGLFRGKNRMESVKINW